MALLDRILGRRKPEQRAIDVLPWDAGGPIRPSAVSVDQALGLVPVFAAVRLLASQIASLPLQTYRKAGDTRIPVGEPSLFRSPSVNGTLFDWLHRCVTSLALRGNAYGYVTSRDSATQYPTMIEWLHPDEIQCQDHLPAGRGSFTAPVWWWKGREIPAEDLLHIPWFTVPGKVQGLSPIGACMATISTGLSAQDYTQTWFANGAIPPGKFRNTARTINQADADTISARLDAAIRRRRPLVYGSDWEYEPIAVAAHEAKFIETLQMTATNVASIYGVPPEMIGGQAGGPLTYNTVALNAEALEKFTLRPWLELLEGAFSRLLPRPQYVKFNTGGLLRTDLTTRMQAYQTARQIGLHNLDELRALEDLRPIPNGQGQDYTPLEILTKQAGPQPVQTRFDTRRPAEIIHATRGRTSGPEALYELTGAKIDPTDPAYRHMPGGHQHNQLSHAGDGLGLARRIDLGHGESLIASGKLEPEQETADLLYAVVDGPDGLQIRLGIIDPEGAERWQAGNKGGTANLNVEQARTLRRELAAANDDAKRHAKQANDAWNSGTAPTEPVLIGNKPVTSGRIRNAWGDLTYDVYLTDDDPTSWQTFLTVDATADSAALNPKELQQFLGKLDEMTGSTSRSASDYSEAGPRSLAAALMADLRARRDDPYEPGGLAADTRHLPGKHNQKDHGRPGAALKAVTEKILDAVPDVPSKGSVRPKKPPNATGPVRRPVRGRDLIGSDGHLADAVDREAESNAYPSNGYGLMDGPNGDEHMAAIAARQGFTGKPQVVSSSELDALIASGHQEMFRGVRRGERADRPSPAEINESLRTGNAFYGFGVYGNGIYATDIPRRARAYADEESEGSVVRMALSPEARVLTLSGDWEELYASEFMKEHAAFLENLDPNDAAFRVFGDMGRYAAARGYDAIRINHPYGETETVILNRTALAVEVAQ